jgi:Tfp pilus assembly protein FimT
MEPIVTRDDRGLTLLDVLVVLGLLALLVWFLRMDWAGHRRLREEPAPTAIAAP